MTNEILSPRPLSAHEKIMQEKFAEHIAAQSEQMDIFARHLITLELAVPGVYIAALKAGLGGGAVVAADRWFYLAFACWFLALCLGLLSLIPRRWHVDPACMKMHPSSRGAMGIEDFFHLSARYKRRLLIPSAVFFFLGVLGVAVNLGNVGAV